MKDASFFTKHLDKGAPNLFNNKDLLRNSVMEAKFNYPRLSNTALK